MSKELIYSKGLLIETVSWENDGDYYKTTENSVADKEFAIEIVKMLNSLFKSENGNQGEPQIGNTSDDCEERIERYRKNNEYFRDKYSEEDFFEFVDDISENYLDYSEEGYIHRVCEKATLYEIMEDVYLDKIEVEI